jgi:hypothetical protein
VVSRFQIDARLSRGLAALFVLLPHVAFADGGVSGAVGFARAVAYVIVGALVATGIPVFLIYRGTKRRLVWLLYPIYIPIVLLALYWVQIIGPGRAFAMAASAMLVVTWVMLAVVLPRTAPDARHDPSE